MVPEKIKTSKFDPFTGPMTAQDGSVKVADGKMIGDGDLWNMNYLVSNVKGSMK